MKKHAHVAIAIAIVSSTAILLAFEVWYWLDPADRESHLYAMFVTVPMTAVLLWYLVLEYRTKLRLFPSMASGARLTPGSKCCAAAAVVLVALWVSSELWWCELRWECAPGKSIYASSSVSALGFGLASDPSGLAPWSTGFQCERIDQTTLWKRRWFSLDTFSTTIQGNRFSTSDVVFPHALPLGMVLTAPVICMVRGYRRWRDRGEHYCGNCDYDLTGNVSGVCPECGTAIESSANKSQSLENS